MGRPTPDAIAREALGFRLRPEQRAAVEAVAAGRDALVVMPTGSGKSAIYQVAGMLVPGVTLVVSPLIALQRDQLAAIEESGLSPAAALNSTLAAGERREALEALEADELEFVFLAPEQLRNDDTLARLRAAEPSLLVVDEAHCISEWGHDFRPDYLRLGTLAAEIGRPTVLALTATASPPVRDEIVARLALDDPLVVVHGFDRPNIRLAVETFVDEDAKREAVAAAVDGAEKPGIVYAATRARAEELAAELESRGLRARAYHAGLAKGEREAAQQAFTDDDLDAIVATTAFGMGIDKSNVRFVFHLDPSDSVDSYYQEIGRAGRDGADAHARLFFRAEDLGLRRFFAGSGNVDADEVERVADVLREADEPVHPSLLRDRTGLSQSKLATAVGRLDDVGAVEILPGGEVAPVRELDAGDVEAAAQAQQRRREFDRSRLEMMRAYAESGSCRRAFVLSYFGEPFEPPCGNCDVCDARPASDADDLGARPFEVAARVRHGEWGEGAVQRYEGDKMTVLFDEAGYKTLAVGLVVEGGLLEPA